ncbi:MAG: DNA alkylation repair protein [Saprospiraceae bacterium]|nr:DNA alkylation repair protein [Saprospiraceae bacterium]
MAESFLIRDVFNINNVVKLGQEIKETYPEFDLDTYKSRLLHLLSEATFSERKKAITDCLIELLPSDYLKVIEILLACLPPAYEEESLDSDMDRFIVAPMAEVVARKGLSHFDASMQALYQMTKTFTAEWAIRPFIEKFPQESHNLLMQWAGDPNAHVRRLVSEGTRPYLPWGKKLSITEKDPEWSLSILERLIDDSSKYVVTSVANHLNDLTRKHPGEVLISLNKWKGRIHNHKPIPFFKKALRNLIKAGNTAALELIGFSSNVQVRIDGLSCLPQIKMGEKMEFTFDIHSTADKSQEILIDFIIHFHKSNGSLLPKVFKLTSFTLSSASSKCISKSFSFKPITTRKYYPGPHKLEIMVNGKVMAKKKFTLINP